jgi:hypothetical protein
VAACAADPDYRLSPADLAGWDRAALERRDAAIQAWLAEHYPKIAARAKAEGAVLHWGDETGISNQPVYGRSFAPKGQTPVLRRPATRRRRCRR